MSRQARCIGLVWEPSVPLIASSISITPTHNSLARTVPHRSRAQFQRRLDARLCCLDGTTQQQLGALKIRRRSRQPHLNTGKPGN